MGSENPYNRDALHQCFLLGKASHLIAKMAMFSGTIVLFSEQREENGIQNHHDASLLDLGI